MRVLPDCCMVSLVVPAFINIEGRYTVTKNYCRVSLLFVVSKVLKNFVNNWIFDNLEKSGLFSDFSYRFRFS